MPNSATALRISRAQAEDFLFRQAKYIDTRDFESWLSLFTSDGRYWIPARPTDTDPETQLSFMFDDMPTMAARCGRLLDPNTPGQQPPTRSSHIIGNVCVDDVPNSGDVVVHSRFHVTQFRRNIMKYYSGEYTHHLALAEDGIKIRLQRIDLIDCDAVQDQILQVYL